MWRMQWAMACAIMIAVFIACIKWIAYSWTGSQAVFADCIESIVHIWIALLVAATLKYSAKPPDHEHRYGHGKVTYFTAALEGVFITGAGAASLTSAIYSWLYGWELADLGAGIFLELIVVVLNGIVGRSLLQVGYLYNNLGVVAHGKHVLTDMWSTAGVVVSLICVWLTGWYWLDILIASAVSLHIIWTGLTLCYEAYERLMERTDEAIHATILGILDKAMQEGEIGDYHQLRHRRINDNVWIEVHMLFDDQLTLQEAHSRATRVEMQIVEHFGSGDTYITSHLEPLSHKEAHPKNHPERQNSDASLL
jgi:cation diffusion facilitator family transporter